jgi:hypothetical protein
MQPGWLDQLDRWRRGTAERYIRHPGPAFARGGCAASRPGFREDPRSSMQLGLRATAPAGA